MEDLIERRGLSLGTSGPGDDEATEFELSEW